METVLRALAIYVFLLLIFRICGKRSLAQITSFDFVLLLVVGEASQQALIGEDYSLTTAMIAICTLIGIDIALSRIKQRHERIDRWLEDLPLVLIEHGHVFRDRLRAERVDLDDVLSAARQLHGLERLDQIRYAVLERNGEISIIPESDKASA
jgi:uncharacterized membrane protein YcaP (DUF421 family)